MSYDLFGVAKMMLLSTTVTLSFVLTSVCRKGQGSSSFIANVNDLCVLNTDFIFCLSIMIVRIHV